MLAMFSHFVVEVDAFCGSQHTSNNVYCLNTRECIWDVWVKFDYRDLIFWDQKAESKKVPVNQNSRKEPLVGIFVFCFFSTDMVGVVSWWQLLMERGSDFSALQRLWRAVIAQQKGRCFALGRAEKSAERGQLLKTREELASA